MTQPFTPAETSASLARGDAFWNQLSRAHAVELLGRIAALEAALLPFADHTKSLDRFDDMQSVTVLLRDCRRAKTVLEKGR